MKIIKVFLVVLWLVSSGSSHKCELKPDLDCLSCLQRNCVYFVWKAGHGCFENETSHQGHNKMIISPGSEFFCKFAPNKSDAAVNDDLYLSKILLAIFSIISGIVVLSFAIYKLMANRRTAEEPQAPPAEPFQGDMGVLDGGNEDEEAANENEEVENENEVNENENEANANQNERDENDDTFDDAEGSDQAASDVEEEVFGDALQQLETSEFAQFFRQRPSVVLSPLPPRILQNISVQEVNEVLPNPRRLSSRRTKGIPPARFRSE